ncbi:response regulator [Paraflavitalea soli]|uniref:histidine kinase n=1 Tax=Paraflavitalea soli TaxID=2315862 RepID=A0A3B7MK07_9BACT|nr:two-component regulator propeller domain-containing protein [Paraflavitalea soli]AXY73589.1 response regulator [Paraflavitalea soli]
MHTGRRSCLSFSLPAWIAILLCMVTGRAAAHEGLPLSYLGIEQGLSNNAVRSIFQDHRGFMWFGTFDGLNRYDGYGFQVFRNTFHDTGSLADNLVHTINEDRDGNIWAGTNQGVSIYAAATGRFSPLRYKPYGAPAIRILNTETKDIQRTRAGDMLVASLIDGLLIAPQGYATAWQVPLVINDTIYTNYAAGTIRIDDQQQVWVFVISKGLCRYDAASRQLRLVNGSLKAAFSFLPDGSQFWVGTNNGIFTYDTRTNTYARALNQYDAELATDKVAGFAIDRQRRLWMVTKGNGVKFYDPATRQVTHLVADGRLNSISNENFNTVVEDREGRIWLGSHRGGINIIDRQKDRFTTIAHDPLDANSLVNNYVSAFYEMSDGRIWVGSEFGGLSLWDRRNNQFTNFKYNASHPEGISNNFITSIREDHTGQVWIATYWGGINRFNRSNNTFTRYKCLNPAFGNQENKMVYQLLVDKEGILWATTLQEGGMKGALYRYNKAADRFEAFDTRLSELFVLTEDSQGALWSGNLSQLIRIDRQSRQHEYYTLGNTIRSIVEDAQGNLWVGTEGGGLVLFDRTTKSIVARYTMAEGLCNNAVLNILPDGKGNLWISTFNGVSRFHIATKTFQNYYQGDGLQSNQFNPNTCLALRSGELMFGGIKGFNIFHPEKILSTARPAQVFLTGITVDNKPVPFTEQIKVPYSQAVFSFQYVVPEYSTPGKISYAYYMEGWDRGWNYTGNLRTASYTHLNEGHYVFRVKSTNTDGVWNPEEVVLHITVLPPWYRTWLAYFLYAAVVVSLIYTWWRYRSRQTRLKYEVAIAHLDAENKRAELELERAEREKEQVLNEQERAMQEKKLTFFTNISHEFRTPLTLIINPVKDLLSRQQEEPQKTDGDLQTVYRNARRMLSLVDQLLLFRKAESGHDRIRPGRQDVCALAHDVYLCFVQQAKAKKISYEFTCSNEQLEVYADREKLEIILYNLLSNALKYTPDGGHIVLMVGETAGEIVIRVQDNGIGIGEDAGEQLFEKFYRASGKMLTTQKGFGIGLYLVKHFTAQHKGRIAYESKEGEGTVFTLHLLKGQQHFDAGTIIEQEPAQAALLEELALEDALSGQAASTEQPDGPLEAVVSEKKSILLIDDDDQLLQYLTTLFKNTYQVYLASDGEDGLKLARKHLPDLIVSDVQMQGMSGIDLCSHIKEDASLQHIPVILLTASTSSEVKLKGVEGGADDYITKPFDKDILVARVASLLKARTILQHYFYNAITLNNTDQKISQEYKEFLERCIAIVENNLENEDFNLKMLLAEIGMSRSNLFRKVKLVSGLSIKSFIRFIRLRKAAELFINTNYNVGETAFRVGIYDIKFFRAEFNKVFGINPSEYIKKYRKAFGSQYQVNLKDPPPK